MKNFSKALFILFILFFAPFCLLFLVPDYTINQYIKKNVKAYDIYGEDAENIDAEKLTYPVKLEGLAKKGSRIYAKLGCAHCHTQVVRPSYIGADLLRSGWGGRGKIKIKDNQENFSRITKAEDYYGEDFAKFGSVRLGPDLSNVGHRYQNEDDLYRKIYNPKLDNHWTNMPAYKLLFKEINDKNPNSPASKNAITISENQFIIPTADAKALITYLQSLKKDQKAPK